MLRRAEAIARDTKSGDPSLADARQALLNAALDVRDWTTTGTSQKVSHDLVHPGRCDGEN